MFENIFTYLCDPAETEQAMCTMSVLMFNLQFGGATGKR